MTVIFASPSGTGKTTFGAALAKHFGCTVVIEAEELNRMSDEALKHSRVHYALVLCQSADEVPQSPYIRQCRTLHRDEMNRAMAAVGTVPIWNDDGSVNTFGKRKELK